jgi:hypothetical protein
VAQQLPTLGYGPGGSVAYVVLLGFNPAPVAAHVGPTLFASTAERDGIDPGASTAVRDGVDPYASTAEPN